MGNPVRKIPHRTRGVRGYFFSLKNGRRVDYESLNEQALFKVLETDSYIASYCEQPVQLEYEWNGKLRRYTPDVLSTDIHSHSVLYEVKPEEAIKKDDGRLAAKFEQARLYGLERGWGFEVITDAIRTSPEYRRADFLWPHLMSKTIEPSIIDAVLANVHAAEQVTIDEITANQTWGDPVYCAMLYLIGCGKLIEDPYGFFEPESILKVFAGNVER